MIWRCVALPILLTTACVSSPGSRLPDPSPLQPLFESLVTGQPVLIAPSHRWSTSDCEGWAFRGFATLLIHVDQELAASSGFDRLEIRLRSSAPAAPEHPVARLDGQPLAIDVDDEYLKLLIPGVELPGASHRLRLETRATAQPASLIDYQRSCFGAIEYDFGEGPREIEPAHEERVRLIAEHLNKGVAGSDASQRSGTLFAGPRQRSVDLSFDRESQLSFHLRNHSQLEAAFSLTLDGQSQEVQVAADATRRHVTEIPAGNHRLELAVEGAEHGLFLWGSPHLVGMDKAASEATPVILVTLDTTRRDALSIYGNSEVSTPNLDLLAEHSTVYQRAYAASPWTLPSHASIFTGLNPSAHGAGVTYDHLHGAHSTLAERFRDRGYFTAGFAGGELCSSMWGLGQGFHLYTNPRNFEERGDYMVEQVTKLLEERFPEDRRLFLFVNFFDPHALYLAPEPHKSRHRVNALSRRLKDPDWRAMSRLDSQAWLRIITGKSDPKTPELRYLRAAYLAEVGYVDEQLGRLFDVLRAHNLYDDALVVVTSDHGEYLGEKGLFSHGLRLDPEMVEIPLLVKEPRQSEARREEALVTHTDLFDLLRSVLSGDELELPETQSQGRPTLLSEEHESIVHPFFPELKIASHFYALQSQNRRTVVWNGGIECQEGGVGDWRDVDCSASSDALLERVVAIAGAAVDPVTNAGDAVTSDQAARLRSLGYMQ